MYICIYKTSHKWSYKVYNKTTGDGSWRAFGPVHLSQPDPPHPVSLLSRCVK